MRIIALSLIIIGVGCWAITANNATEQDDAFIVKKKKRSSVSELKEDVGNEYVGIARELPELICFLAQCETALVDRTQELIDGQITTKQQELKKHLHDLHEFKQELVTTKQQLKSMASVLQTKIISKQ